MGAKRRLTAEQKAARAKRATLATVMMRVPREFQAYATERANAMTQQTGITHTGADVIRLMLARAKNG